MNRTKGSKTRDIPWAYWITLFTIVALAVGIMSCKSDDTAEFAVETLAMSVGYELRNSFDWTATTDAYYTAVMEGKMDLNAAQAAEDYLRTVTHPLIANRLVRLAGLVGFTLDDLGGITDVTGVDIRLLQVAAQGFKLGLTLE